MRPVVLSIVLFIGFTLSQAHCAEQIRILEDATSKLIGWPAEAQALKAPDQDGYCVRLELLPKKGPQMPVFNFAATGVEIGDWVRLEFDYRVNTVPKSLALKITDAPLVDGREAVWFLQIPKDAPGTWQHASIPLQKPTYIWGNTPDPTAKRIVFRTEHNGAKPLELLIANLRILRPEMTIDFRELSPIDRDVYASATQPVSRTLRFALKNNTDTRRTAVLSGRSDSPHVRFPESSDTVILPPASTVDAEIQMSVSPKIPAFTRLPYTVEVRAKTGADVESTYSGEFAMPMPPLPHPCLLFTKDQLPRIRRRIVEWEGGKRWWKGIKQNADGWLDRTPAYPDRGSQWWHWYSCRKCGTSLKTKSPTKHVCPACGEVHSGYPYDDVVLDRDHHRLARTVRDLGIVYQVTEDKRYADKAREILTGYAERYLKYPLHNIHGEAKKGGGHVTPQTLDESVWLIPITQGYDLIQETLNEEDKTFLAEKMLIPAARLIKEHQWGIHNICCWHDSAYGLVGIALENAEFASAAIAGPKGFRAQTEEGITDDGQWYERSWGYHFYTMMALEPLAIATHNLGIDVHSPKYKSLYDAALKFVTPTHQLPAFNDSGRTGFGAGKAKLYESAYAWWGDPAHAFVVSQRKRDSMGAVIWGADEVKTGTAVAFGSGVYKDVGVLVLRTQSAALPAGAMPSNYLALDFGEHGGGHGHPDKLNIVLWGRGKLISEDPGCIAYGNPAHRGWYRQTLSHNTLVVDGRSQAPTTGELLFASFDKNAGMACALTDKAYQDVTLGRAVAMVDDIVLDLCWTQSAVEHQYEWTFHARGELASLPEGEAGDPGKGDGYSWVKNWQRASHAGNWNAAWIQKDGTRLRLAQQCPSGELWTGNGTGNPPTVKIPVSVSRTRGKAAIYRTVMCVDSADADSAPSLELKPVAIETDDNSQCYAMCAQIAEREFVFAILPAGGRARVNGHQVEGKGALIISRAGTIERILLANGEAKNGQK